MKWNGHGPRGSGQERERALLDSTVSMLVAAHTPPPPYPHQWLPDTRGARYWLEEKRRSGLWEWAWHTWDEKDLEVGFAMHDSGLSGTVTSLSGSPSTEVVLRL